MSFVILVSVVGYWWQNYDFGDIFGDFLLTLKVRSEFHGPWIREQIWEFRSDLDRKNQKLGRISDVDDIGPNQLLSPTSITTKMTFTSMLGTKCVVDGFGYFDSVSAISCHHHPRVQHQRFHQHQNSVHNIHKASSTLSHFESLTSLSPKWL